MVAIRYFSVSIEFDVQCSLEALAGDSTAQDSRVLRDRIDGIDALALVGLDLSDRP